MDKLAQKLKASALLGALCFALLSLPTASFGESYVNSWKTTTFKVVVQKDLGGGNLQSASVSRACTTAEIPSCPSNHEFRYTFSKKATHTSTFPYDTFSVSEKRNSAVTNQGWIATLKDSGGHPLEGVVYHIPEIVNGGTTPVAFDKNGDGGTTLPKDTSGKSGGGTPVNTPASPTTATTPAAPTGEPLEVKFGGFTVPVLSLDSSACTDKNSKTVDNVKVFSKGILTDLPCAGAIDSLPEVLTFVKNLVSVFLLPLVGIIFTIVLLLGGILYITSRGNQTQLDRAKKTLTAAIIGLLIVTLSYTIIWIFAGVLGGGIG